MCALVTGVQTFALPISTGTFIALIIISLLLDEAGFFAWAALHVARWGRGSGRKLFAFMVLLGALVSALFANDGAALILTPIVISMLLALRFSPAATLAFVMRSEEHTSELQSLMRISYAVFCLKKKKYTTIITIISNTYLQ